MTTTQRIIGIDPGLVYRLEDNDDVQDVYTNVEISDADAARLSAS